MFINKINNNELNQSTSQKMTSAINIFLKTELTCIPRLLTKLFGNYYNNALCNTATWVFAVWCIVHALFDTFMEVFLRKLRYREYARLRLKTSLWYLGFYGAGLVYCYQVLSENGFEFFTLKKIYPFWVNDVNISSNLFSSVMLGYMMLLTFFLHSAVWEGLSRRCLLGMLSYGLLFVFMLSCYISGVPEIFGLAFKLTMLISISQLALEFTKCWFMSSVQDSFSSKLVGLVFYLISFTIYTTVHLIVIPLICLVRLGLSIMSESPSVLLVFLFMVLLGWLGAETYQSALYRFLNHWLYHRKEVEKDNASDSSDKVTNDIACNNSLLECSLFQVRDDQAYHIRIILNEIEDRKAKMLAQRKPKNMFFQTLKCMVAIKRKLSARRLSESDFADQFEATDDKSDGDEDEFHSEEENEDDDEVINELSNETGLDEESNEKCNKECGQLLSEEKGKQKCEEVGEGRAEM